MANCGTCSKGFTQQHIKITCIDCERDFHGKCVSMGKSDIDYLTSANLSWRCQVCSIERRKSMKLESDSSSGNITLQDIMDELKTMKQLHISTSADFNQAIENVDSKLDCHMKESADKWGKIEYLLEKLENLEKENHLLKNKIKDLEARIEDEEQYSRVNCIEIHGIPHQPNENVLQIVKDVGVAIDFKVSDEAIDNCHRLGRSVAGKPVPGIIVKFTRRLDKEEFLRKKRIRHNLSTRHMGLTTDLPVFVNESLCSARRRVYALARQAKKTKQYKYIWLRGGKILMRKNDGEPVKVISCVNDLEML